MVCQDQFQKGKKIMLVQIENGITNIKTFSLIIFGIINYIFGMSITPAAKNSEKQHIIIFGIVCYSTTTNSTKNFAKNRGEFNYGSS